jgi:hypothetical protein
MISNFDLLTLGTNIDGDMKWVVKKRRKDIQT